MNWKRILLFFTSAPEGIRAWFKKPVLLFLVPTFVLLIIFSYVPFFTAFSYSLFRWDGMNPERDFVGFGNFLAVLRNPRFIGSVGNVLILLVAAILKILTIPILVAELLFAIRRSRFAYAYRVLFVLPMVVPMLVFMLIWQKFFQADYGLINQVIRLFGNPDFNRAWLGETKYALGSLIFMGFPWVHPIAVLLILSGLLAIPQSLLDAARVDGAGFLRRFLYVDLHLILGQVKLLIVLTILGVIQEFYVQFIMTYGGPANSTMTPGLHMFLYAFSYGRLGYASAVAVILFLVMLTLTVLNMRYIRSDVEYEATA
jgi:ABC-type sugar transport system permease subunit